MWTGEPEKKIIGGGKDHRRYFRVFSYLFSFLGVCISSRRNFFSFFSFGTFGLRRDVYLLERGRLALPALMQYSVH